MTKIPQAIMQDLINQTKESIDKEQSGPFGAVIVKNGEIVGKGINKVTLHNDPTAHAEVMAIRDACRKLGTFQLNGCEIYCTCEPCPMCLGAIYWARIDKVFFAATRDDAANADFDDSMIYNELALPYEQRKLKFNQILRDESLSIFDTWKQNENKIKY